MPKPHCWPSCRKRQVVCALTAGRNGRRRRATKCLSAWHRSKYGLWQVKEWRQEPVWLAPRQMPQLAPLFSRRMLGESRALKITTTLDATLQRQLEELALSVKTRLPLRSSLAMIVVDHTDMKVRGWVGSVDINDDSRFSHVDMVSAVRSPDRC